MADTLTEMEVCLNTLEKRIKQGPGSISAGEVSDLDAAIAQLVESADAVADQSTAPSGDAPDVITASEDESDPLEPFPDPALKLGAGWKTELRKAITNLDTETVSSMLAAGAEMDESMTNDAFWAVVGAVDRAEKEDKALSGSVPTMLHHIFDEDHRMLLQREQIRTNVTCMKPDESGGIEVTSRRMG